MKLREIFCLALTICAALWISIPPAYGQEELPGADSVFYAKDMVVLWGILKGVDEEHSWVDIKIILPGPARWKSFEVEAVDPFSKEKEVVTPRRKLEKENVVRSRRSSFRDKTGRRILFYGGEDGKDRPGKIVFYQGIPDTTPECSTELQLKDYFSQALKRLNIRQENAP